MDNKVSEELKNKLFLVGNYLLILTIMIACHLTGGLSSPFFQMFIFPIVISTFFLTKSDVIISSTSPLVFWAIEYFMLSDDHDISGFRSSYINLAFVIIVIMVSQFLVQKRIADKQRLDDVINTLELTDNNQKDAIMELIDSERKLRLQQKEAEVRNAELEMTRKSMINLLEDLDVERAKIEMERNRFEAVLQSVSEGIMMVDKNGKAVLVNKGFEKMFNLLGRELVGKDPSFYTNLAEKYFKNPEDYNAWVEEAYDKTITREEEWETSSKPPKYIRRFTTPVRGYRNARIGRIWTFRDATRDKEIDEMRSQFVSLASHHLRTPLSAIRWFLEMVVNEDVGKLNAKQKDLLDKAYQSTTRLSELVNALLNISRIESGRIAITPTPTDIIELVKTVVMELRPMITVKKHHLVENYEKDLPLINIDQRLVNAAIANLVSNAAKYTPVSGQIEIKVKKDGHFIVVSVKDTGIGIPRKDYPQVFEKFYRSDKAVASETEGTGLGLYIVKAVIESSGGKVWFKSSEGKGTTFYLSLPLKGSRARKGEKTLA